MLGELTTRLQGVQTYVSLVDEVPPREDAGAFSAEKAPIARPTGAPPAGAPTAEAALPGDHAGAPGLPPGPPPTAALAGEMTLLLGRLVRLLRRNASDGGLPRPLVSALATLDAEDGLSPTDLAELEGVAKASISPILASLETSGLVTRTPHRTDGRQCVITISAGGKAALALERAKKHAWLAGRLADLQAEDREALEEAIPALRHLVGG